MNVGRFVAIGTLLLFGFPRGIGAAQTARTPVIVELFTSEGCSSCPPADALLARLEREQSVAAGEVIVLEEHVDYWDSLGWHDRFSSPVFTQRQRQYGVRFGLPDIYTPQMVTAGSTQFVGSDARAAIEAVRRGAQETTYPLLLTEVEVEKNHISARVRIPVESAGGGPGQPIFDLPPDVDLYAALVSPNQTTVVDAGENGGRTLHHVGVVRSLICLGNIAAFRRSAMKFSLDTRGIVGPLRIVVFAQKTGLGAILGAATKDLPQGATGRLAASLE